MGEAFKIVNYKKDNGESEKEDNGRALFGGIHRDLQHLSIIFSVATMILTEKHKAWVDKFSI